MNLRHIILEDYLVQIILLNKELLDINYKDINHLIAHHIGRLLKTQCFARFVLVFPRSHLKINLLKDFHTIRNLLFHIFFCFFAKFIKQFTTFKESLNQGKERNCPVQAILIIIITEIKTARFRQQMCLFFLGS